VGDPVLDCCLGVALSLGLGDFRVLEDDEPGTAIRSIVRPVSSVGGSANITLCGDAGADAESPCSDAVGESAGKPTVSFKVSTDLLRLSSGLAACVGCGARTPDASMDTVGCGEAGRDEATLHGVGVVAAAPLTIGVGGPNLTCLNSEASEYLGLLAS
jgi:hypothetical protein